MPAPETAATPDATAAAVPTQTPVPVPTPPTLEEQLARLKIVPPCVRRNVRVLDPALVDTGAGTSADDAGGFGLSAVPAPAPRTAEEQELDACAAAHVRWPDSEQMRVACTLRAARDAAEAGEPRAPAATPWRDLVALASHAEDALLRGRVKLLARPFAAAASDVRPLGVSALYAALLCANGRRIAAPATATEAGVDAAAAQSGAAAAAEALVVVATTAAAAAVAAASDDGLELDCVHVCALSRAVDLAWTRTAALVKRGSVRASALYGAELLLCLGAEACDNDNNNALLVVLALPDCTHSTFTMPLSDPADEPAPAAAAAENALSASAPACALSERFVVCAHGRTLEVWRRGRATLSDELVRRVATPSREGEGSVLAPRLVCGASAHARYEHTEALVGVRLDACVNAGSRLLLCSDARGGLLCFRLAEAHENLPRRHAADADAEATEDAEDAVDAESSPLVLPPFCIAPQAAAPGAGDHAPAGSAAEDVARLLRADEAVVALAVAGSRFVLATTTRLLIYDAERTPGPGLPKGAGRLGALSHALELGAQLGLGAPVSLALWGEAVVVHDAEQRVAIVDARPGRVTKTMMGNKLRAGVPAHAAEAPRYQSTATACDQVGVLLSNGTLMLLNVEA